MKAQLTLPPAVLQLASVQTRSSRCAPDCTCHHKHHSTAPPRVCAHNHDRAPPQLICAAVLQLSAHIEELQHVYRGRGSEGADAGRRAGGGGEAQSQHGATGKKGRGEVDGHGEEAYGAGAHSPPRHARGPIALPASSSHGLGSRRVRRGAQVGEEVEVLETQLNEENGQIRCESLRDVPQQRSAKQRRRPWEMIGRSIDKLTPPAARRVRIADGWASLTDTFGEPLLEPC